MKVTQIRFEGFLKTPTLWESTHVYDLSQFKIEQKLRRRNNVARNISVSYQTYFDEIKKLLM